MVRVTTLPRWNARNCSKANSRGVRWIGCPARLTVRAVVSIARSWTRNTGSFALLRQIDGKAFLLQTSLERARQRFMIFDQKYPHGEPPSRQITDNAVIVTRPQLKENE